MTVWWQHARVPLAAFVLVAALLSVGRIDTTLAHLLFFDAVQSRWIGADSWWTNEFLHTGGQWTIRVLTVGAGLLFGLTFKLPRLRIYRRPSGYFFVAVALSVGLISILKGVMNVDCPWDLTEFGGKAPYVHLFAHHPGTGGRCFPAGHAGCGYSLLAFYFAMRERGKLLARTGLALGLATGIIFGIAQQSRGAHFLSHDIWSGFLVWITSLTVYVFGFKARLWNTRTADS